MGVRRLSLIALVAVALVCTPAMSAPVETENIAVKPSAEVVTVGNTEAPAHAIANVRDHVIIIEHAAYRSDMIHYAVLRSGPDRLTAFQMSSLVDLSDQSQFINYANRLRTTHIT